MNFVNESIAKELNLKKVESSSALHIQVASGECLVSDTQYEAKLDFEKIPHTSYAIRLWGLKN